MQKLPHSLRRRSDVDAIREDIRPYLGTSIEERSELVSSLCRLAAEQLDARPDGARIRAFQEPPAPSYFVVWGRLLERAKAA